MKHSPLLLPLVLGLISGTSVSATVTPEAWPNAPVTLQNALDIALTRSPAILKGKQEVEESQGLALQLKSVVTPKVAATGGYNIIDQGKIEKAQFSPAVAPFSFQQDQNWNAGISVFQPLFAGGKLRSSLRSAKLTKAAALASYQALVADALLDIRITYADILLATELIKTQEASVQLLQQELVDTRRRFEAGTVPQFNVLRAEVELANAKPKLIRARNARRLAKNNLATLLGWNVPQDAGLDIPLELADTLRAEPYATDLSAAVLLGLRQRPELAGLRLHEKQRTEEVIQAKSDYVPKLNAVAGYGWQSRSFTSDLSQENHGWSAGLQLNWSLFDFDLTRGKVAAAQAHQERARVETQDTFRKIEQEIRTAHSNLLEAREVLESQAKVIEQGTEALRLANARVDAGSGTQLEVLSAQTALTEARTTYSQTLRDYVIARARLERATGQGTTLQSDR
jgi:outer membrane protein TolC